MPGYNILQLEHYLRNEIIRDPHNYSQHREREHILMEGVLIDRSRRIVDSLIGRKVKILGYEQNLPKGDKFILGDRATVAL